MILKYSYEKTHYTPRFIPTAQMQVLPTYYSDIHADQPSRWVHRHRVRPETSQS